MAFNDDKLPKRYNIEYYPDFNGFDTIEEAEQAAKDLIRTRETMNVFISEIKKVVHAEHIEDEKIIVEELN